MKQIFKLNPYQASDRPCIVIELITKDRYYIELGITLITINSALYLFGIKTRTHLVVILSALAEKDPAKRASALNQLAKDNFLLINAFYGEANILTFLNKEKNPIQEVELDSDELTKIFIDIDEHINDTAIWNYILKTGYIILLADKPD